MRRRDGERAGSGGTQQTLARSAGRWTASPSAASLRAAATAAMVSLICLAEPGSATASLAKKAQPPTGIPSPHGVEVLRSHATGAAAMPVAQQATAHPLTRLRKLYYSAVDDRESIGAALAEIDRLRAAGQARTGSRHAALLDAYRGAVTTLRAKHGRWPPDRLRHLNNGLRQLDNAIADAPDVVEIRYLRLMSCYYLPGVLGRGSSVREDFDALARLLPGAADEFPAELYRAIISFVLEHGDPGASQRAALEAAVRASYSNAG